MKRGAVHILTSEHHGCHVSTKTDIKPPKWDILIICQHIIVFYDYILYTEGINTIRSDTKGDQATFAGNV